MRYRAVHVEHAQHPRPGGIEPNGRALDAAQGKKIERPGWHPTARDDLNLSRHECTALRSLVHEGIAA